MKTGFKVFLSLFSVVVLFILFFAIVGIKYNSTHKNVPGMGSKLNAGMVVSKYYRPAGTYLGTNIADAYVIELKGDFDSVEHQFVTKQFFDSVQVGQKINNVEFDLTWEGRTNTLNGR